MVSVGDKVLIFKDQNGDDVIVDSAPIGVRDKVLLFQGVDGEYYTVKSGPIGVGDKVLIFKDQNGDDVIIKPGGCIPIDLSLVYSYLGAPNIYVYKMSEDFTFTDRFHFPQLNLKMDFGIRCGGLDEVELPYPGETSGVDWWPCGGVWVGLGSPDSYGDINMGSWLWILHRGPYMTIGDLPNTIINPAYSIYGEGYMPLMGINMPGNPWRWCITNLLSYYTAVNNVNNFTFRYIQVHIRGNISLFFGGGPVTSLLHNIQLCQGVECGEGGIQTCMDKDNPPKWCHR